MAAALLSASAATAMRLRCACSLRSSGRGGPAAPAGAASGSAPTDACTAAAAGAAAGLPAAGGPSGVPPPGATALPPAPARAGAARQLPMACLRGCPAAAGHRQPARRLRVGKAGVSPTFRRVAAPFRQPQTPRPPAHLLLHSLNVRRRLCTRDLAAQKPGGHCARAGPRLAPLSCDSREARGPQAAVACNTRLGTAQLPPHCCRDGLQAPMRELQPPLSVHRRTCNHAQRAASRSQTPRRPGPPAAAAARPGQHVSKCGGCGPKIALDSGSRAALAARARHPPLPADRPSPRPPLPNMQGRRRLRWSRPPARSFGSCRRRLGPGSGGRRLRLCRAARHGARRGALAGGEGQGRRPGGEGSRQRFEGGALSVRCSPCALPLVLPAPLPLARPVRPPLLCSHRSRRTGTSGRRGRRSRAGCRARSSCTSTTCAPSAARSRRSWTTTRWVLCRAAARAACSPLAPCLGPAQLPGCKRVGPAAPPSRPLLAAQSKGRPAARSRQRSRCCVAHAAALRAPRPSCQPRPRHRSCAAACRPCRSQRGLHLPSPAANPQIPYRCVEVNPLTKAELKWSDYKKVPVVVVDGQQVRALPVQACAAQDAGG